MRVIYIVLLMVDGLDENDAPPPDYNTTQLNDLVVSLTENKTLVRVATCSLSQFVLDYKNNTQRIINSIKVAKKAGCTYRVGPELEITGYSCEDHFYEMDTLEMSWLYLGKILKLTIPGGNGDNDLSGILCDIGTLVIHKGVRYNCRIFCLNGKILLIRPKMYLADDGNYREHRWFTGWQKHSISLIEDCLLPVNIQNITKQTHAKFGVAMLECIDGTTIASEICEELFTPESPNIMLGLDGCDIISNGSGSHFQLGKRERRHQLIGEATKKNGGVYLYSNLVGCDGSRLVFDGNSMVYMNGKLVVCGEHLTWHDTEVVVATVDLNDVRGYRAAIVSSNDQSVHRDVIVPRIKICDILDDDSCLNFRLTVETTGITLFEPKEASLITDEEFKSLWKLNQLDGKSNEKGYKIYSGENPESFVPDNDQLPMELGDEIGLYTSRWIWDYTIRSSAGGYLLPLSGGVDSTSTAMVIYYMCDKISDFLSYSSSGTNFLDYNKSRLKSQIKTLLENGFLNNGLEWTKEPELSSVTVDTISRQQLMFILLHTANMPTKNNSEKTANSAANLAKLLGSYHMMAPIQNAFNGFVPDSDTSVDLTTSDIKFGYNNYAQETDKDGKKQLITPIENAEVNTIGGIPYFSWEKTNNMLIPKQDNQGGDKNQDLARQNVQARLRMITAYYLAQLLPIYRRAKRLTETTNDLKKENNRSRENIRFLLVLGSSNSDEALRGFFTKYDAASADVNPIGSLSKTHLREFLRWCGRKWKPFADTIDGILDTVASPELKSVVGEGALQDDEADIGMTYDQLFLLGKLRKEEMLGPISMFKRLCPLWYKKKIIMIKEENGAKTKKDINATYVDIANIVRTFFGWYCFNRNKMTIVPASVHGTGYSPDDNRHDLRPVFYPSFWSSETQAILMKIANDMDSKSVAPAPAELAAAEPAAPAPATPTSEGLAAGLGGSYPKYTRRYKEVSNKHTRSRK